MLKEMHNIINTPIPYLIEDECVFELSFILMFAKVDYMDNPNPGVLR